LYRNNQKLIEHETKIMKLIDANKELHELLDGAKSIYLAERANCQKQAVLKEDLEKEIAFWLPGFYFYNRDDQIKATLEDIKPVRIRDDSTIDINDQKFALYGDSCRLMQAISIKSQYQLRYEE
jgi:hypothetical protein